MKAQAYKAGRPDDPNADEIIAASLRRAQAKQSHLASAKKRKATPAHKRTHAVDNESVHTLNESARQVDTRSEIDRDSELPVAWVRPSALDAPLKRPGFEQRWIRYKTSNQEDGDNLEKAFAEGWRPVKPARVARGHELTADLKGKYGQYIVKRGLILMEMPENLFNQKKKFYRALQKKMTEAIDRNYFKLNHPAMPLLQPSRSSRVTTTARRGRLEDAIAGDDEA